MRLGAIAAILAATAALGIYQEVQFHAMPKPMPTYSVGCRKQIEQFIIGRTKDIESLFVRKRIAKQDSIRQEMPLGV
jgi:hypothetical protein